MGKAEFRERRVQARSIRRSLAQITPANANPQQQSPLWNSIPPEIRNYIFTLVVSGPPPVPSCQLPLNRVNRYGLYQRSVSTSLLQTCRRAYYETRSIPMRTSTFVVGDNSSALTYFSNFTSRNTQELNHIILHLGAHHFMPFAGANVLRRYSKLPQCRPRILTVRCLDVFPVMEKGALKIRYPHAERRGESSLLGPLHPSLQAMIRTLPDSVGDFRLEFNLTGIPKQEVGISMENVTQNLRAMSSWEFQRPHASWLAFLPFLRPSTIPQLDDSDVQWIFTPELFVPEPNITKLIELRAKQPESTVVPSEPGSSHLQVQLRVPVHYATISWTRRSISKTSNV